MGNCNSYDEFKEKPNSLKKYLKQEEEYGWMLVNLFEILVKTIIEKDFYLSTLDKQRKILEKMKEKGFIEE